MLRETSAIPYFLHSALRLEEPFTAYKDRTTGLVHLHALGPYKLAMPKFAKILNYFILGLMNAAYCVMCTPVSCHRITQNRIICSV